MTKRESPDHETPRRQPTSSENPPQAQPTNFWTTGKGVLTIVGIALGITAVDMTFILSTLEDETVYDQDAAYLDQPTETVCVLGGIAHEESIREAPHASWVEHAGDCFPTSDQYGTRELASSG